MFVLSLESCLEQRERDYTQRRLFSAAGRTSEHYQTPSFIIHVSFSSSLQVFILSPLFIFSIPAISALLLLLSHSPHFSPSSHPPHFCTPLFIFLTVLQSHTPPLQNVQGVWWTQEGARRGLRLKVEGYRGEEDPRCSSRGHKCHYDRSCTGLSSLPSCTRAHTVRAP